MACNDEIARAKFKATMAKRKEPKKINDSTYSAITPEITYTEYYDWNEMQGKLFTNNTAEKWAKDMVEFAKRPDSLKVGDFFVEYGCDYEDTMKLCERYEVLGRAYKHAKYIIGNRRERGGITNELNSGLVSMGLAQYDKEWRKDHEWKAKLKNEDANAKGNVNVTINRYPSTDVVPEKIKDEA